ncbi:hypothetical protein HRM2_13700 [Desulforapulum autotrophicum HRM2]|uniref:Uncharacterized protein n=1 Tax=Desulforapulum autotrophicum (strain ATCC 43914 / DSM 3382 / VKM B-1955 / HRM2) TaxID=177437 RepID=C0Q8Y9_DESAH|nr:hypothetical protein HRM2_13700 [Desulforapulum autotrophicum HRM2]
MKFILKNTILTLIFLAAITVPAGANEKQKIKHLPHPNWVHPAKRNTYPGYEQLKQNKKTGNDWQYSTNRATGNIRGGGTTAYKDYRPLYTPLVPQRKR